MWIIVTAIVVIFVARPAPARASQVRIPLTIDYITLREALKRKLYTAPGGRAELWNGLDDCQFLYAENPEFARATAGGAATVQLETANSLGLGVAMGSRCLNAVQWSGIVQALGVPYIAPGLQLKFHFTDLNVFDSAHQKTVIVSQGFDLIKGYLIPRLDDFSYDLNPAVQQLAAMIADSVPPDAADRVRAAVASLTAEPNIAALDDGIRVTLVMTVPDVPASDRDSRRCVFAHAGRTQSLPGHARSMGRVHGFFDQAAWRRGRRPAVPRSVAANPARQPLPPGARR